MLTINKGERDTKISFLQSIICWNGKFRCPSLLDTSWNSHLFVAPCSNTHQQNSVVITEKIDNVKLGSEELVLQHREVEWIEVLAEIQTEGSQIPSCISGSYYFCKILVIVASTFLFYHSNCIRRKGNFQIFIQSGNRNVWTGFIIHFLSPCNAHTV